VAPTLLHVEGVFSTDFMTAVQTLFVPSVQVPIALRALTLASAHFSIERSVTEIDFHHLLFDVLPGETRFFADEFPHGLTQKGEAIDVALHHSNLISDVGCLCLSPGTGCSGTGVGTAHGPMQRHHAPSSYSRMAILEFVQFG